MTTPDREERFSILSVPVSVIRWFFSFFSIGTIYLTTANTLNEAVKVNASGWLEIQSIATGELARAGAASGVGAAIIVEAGKMVLAAIWEQRNRRRALEEGRAHQEGREEGHQEGRQEGRQETEALWSAWLQRWEEAEKRGEAFDEPPPRSNQQNGTSG